MGPFSSKVLHPSVDLTGEASFRSFLPECQLNSLRTRNTIEGLRKPGSGPPLGSVSVLWLIVLPQCNEVRAGEAANCYWQKPQVSASSSKDKMV